MSAFTRIDPGHPLTVAARATNDYAERHGMPETIAWLGIDASPEQVAYLAEQRALRAIAAMSGYNMGASAASDERISRQIVQTPLWRDMRMLLVSCYMDGMAIGWKGREIHNGKGGGSV